MSKLTINNFKKTLRYCRKNGWMKAFYAALERMQRGALDEYSPRPPEAEELCRQRETVWNYAPLISILVPAYETKKEYLEQMLESVLAQTYEKWELIIADASATSQVEEALACYPDERIRYRRLEGNGGISENSNRALESAAGSYVGLLDHDDLLTPDALYEAVKAMQTEQRPVFLYTDEDKVDEGLSHYYEPHYKREFNLDLLLSNNYICHFSMIQAAYIKELCFRKEYDGAQDYDLFLRLVAKIRQESGSFPLDEEKLQRRIVHVDKVLYHWRCHAGSTAENPESKRYAYEAGKRAVQDFADSQSFHARAEHTEHLGFYRLVYGEIFESRPDIMAVSGNRIGRGRITGGARGEDMQLLFGGLPSRFSGYMHRASQQQDIAAADLCCMKVRQSLSAEYESLLLREKSMTASEFLAAEADFCRGIRERGGRILFDPLYKA